MYLYICVHVIYIYIHIIYIQRKHVHKQKVYYISLDPKIQQKWRFLSPQNMGCVVLTSRNEGTVGSHGRYLPDSPDSPDPHHCQASENLKNNGQFLLGAPSENFSMWNRRLLDGMFSLVYVNLEKKNGSVTGSVTYVLDGMFQMCQAV